MEKRIAIKFYYKFSEELFHKVMNFLLENNKVFKFKEIVWNSGTVVFEEDIKNFKSKLDSDVDESAIIRSDIGNSFHFGSIRSKNNLFYFSLYLNDFDINQAESLVEFNLKIEGIVYGSLYNDWDVKWQSEEEVVMFEGAGISRSSLKLTRKYNTFTVVDISENYGRSFKITGILFVASWKHWFAEPFFKIIPKQKLIDFKSSFSKTEIDHGILELQLFEELFPEDSYDKYRIVQKEFIEYLDIINLDKSLKEKYGYDGFPF